MKEIQEKYNVKINYLTSKKMKDTFSSVVLTVSLIAGVATVGYEVGMAVTYEKAKDSTIVFDDEEYNIKDLYLVINESTNERSICRSEKIDENINAYYDSEGNLVCKTGTSGYTVKKLTSIFNNSDLTNNNYKIFKENDYIVDSDVLEEEITEVENKYGK